MPGGNILTEVLSGELHFFFFFQSIAIAYDPVDDMVYWSTDQGVFRISRSGGTMPSIVVNEGQTSFWNSKINSKRLIKEVEGQ